MATLVPKAVSDNIHTDTYLISNGGKVCLAQYVLTSGIPMLLQILDSILLIDTS